MYVSVFVAEGRLLERRQACIRGAGVSVLSRYVMWRACSCRTKRVNTPVFVRQKFPSSIIRPKTLPSDCNYPSARGASCILPTQKYPPRLRSQQLCAPCPLGAEGRIVFRLKTVALYTQTRSDGCSKQISLAHFFCRFSTHIRAPGCLYTRPLNQR